jgi:hypothetical protein
MSTTKTFGHQHLTPVPTPLPSVSESAAVGRALCESLCRSAKYRHALRLHRIGNGLFATRFEYQSGYPESTKDRVGPLSEVLSRTTAPFLDDRVRRVFGIPMVAEQPLVGELLIRLYERAEAPDIWVAFEYLPWIEEHLRYRLRLRCQRDGITTDRDFFIHARSAEAALLAGLHFFATSPQAHP